MSESWQGVTCRVVCGGLGILVVMSLAHLYMFKRVLKSSVREVDKCFGRGARIEMKNDRLRQSCAMEDEELERGLRRDLGMDVVAWGWRAVNEMMTDMRARVPGGLLIGLREQVLQLAT